MTKKTKYTVRQSNLKSVRALEVTGPYLPVLLLSEERTYSNFLAFDRRTGVPVPEYTEMLGAALSYAQLNKYALRNATLIGYAFVDGLANILTAEDFVEVCRLNKEETKAGICHSHDFCDANEVMAEAFESIGLTFDPTDANDARLWNEAWGHALLRMIAMATKA